MNINSQDYILHEVQERLSEVFGETVKVLSASALSGGCINHASKIDTNCGRFFLKWNWD